MTVRQKTMSATIVALASYGVWVTAHATWVVTHGGNLSFDGAFNYPLWSVAHFVPAMAFVVILPFQLWSTVRRAYPRVHRIAGRIAAASGVAFSTTALVLPFVMPARPFGERAFMTASSLLFLVFLWRGIAAARRRDFVVHRQWMLRVTALALGPLTNRVIFPVFAAAGIDSMVRFWDLFVTALWFSLAINLAVVEWWLRGALQNLGRAPSAGPQARLKADATSVLQGALR